MKRPADARVAQPLIDLLIRIQQREGSFRKMADSAGTAPDVFARVARGAGGMSAESAIRLAAAYGADYGFTEDQVLIWAGHKSAPAPAPGADRLPTDEEIPDLVAALTPELQMAQTRLSPGEVQTIRNILEHQVRMLTDLARRGLLPPTEYRRGDD